MPSAEHSFRNLILNQRVSAHVRFIAKAEWDANGGQPRADAANAVIERDAAGTRSL